MRVVERGMGLTLEDFFISFLLSAGYGGGRLGKNDEMKK